MVRLRPTRHGNRQLNKAVYRIAVTQIRRGGPGKDYFQRRPMKAIPASEPALPQTPNHPRRLHQAQALRG